MRFDPGTRGPPDETLSGMSKVITPFFLGAVATATSGQISSMQHFNVLAQVRPTFGR
jgi:hypothetical protein